MDKRVIRKNKGEKYERHKHDINFNCQDMKEKNYKIQSRAFMDQQ